MATRIPAVPAFTPISGITHTVFVDNSGNIDASCALFVNVQDANLLELRRMDPTSEVRTLQGRLTGSKLDLTKHTFFDYQMRRKAESLQYKKNQLGISKKQQTAQISKTRSGSYYYSSRDLTQSLQNNLNCPNLDVIIRPPTNSGINDNKYPGYYYDITVPYLSSL